MDATPDSPRDLDAPQAQLAYAIIASLLAHNETVNDLIALMARALDEDTVRALTNTAQWDAYLASRRALERTRADLEKFTAALQQLSDE
jgi:hypothetical protein